MTIQVIKSNTCDQHIVQELKSKLPPTSPHPLCINITHDTLELSSPTQDLDPLRLSVLDTKAQHLQKTLNAQQPLLKALGKDVLSNKGTVIDATAGFGQDSFIMCTYGLHVISIEQNPIVFAILNCLKNMLLKHNPAIRWQVIHGDSIHWLDHIQHKHQVKAIYLDPFFAKKQKSLPKNRIQWLQSLASNDAPAPEVLFNQALQSPIAKIVVKRDLRAGYLCNRLPNAGSITQKTSRFDCYYHAR
tara:strand:+ start:309 stop:1043 length:735 start_codon:yes stop_codon:yes gene_type:complete